MDWINDKGETVFRGKDSFGKAARRVWDERWGGRETHIRAGRFSCVISPEMGYDENGRTLSELVATRMYDEVIGDDGSIKPGSRHWASHLAGRYQSIGLVMSRLYSRHPFYAEIMSDLKAQLRYLLSQEKSLND